MSKANSWWMGANIPGKPRQVVAYAGGFPEYRRHAEAALADGLTRRSWSTPSSRGERGDGVRRLVRSRREAAASGPVRPVARRGDRRCPAAARARRHAPPARRVAADRAPRAMTADSTVGVLGGGVVAERLRRVIADRHHVVGADVGAPVMVLANAGPHAPRAAELLAARDPRRVDVRLDRRRAGHARPRRHRPLGRRHAGRRRGGLARAERAAGPPRRRSPGRLRRAARRRARHGRTGLRPRAPPLPARAGPSAGTTTTGSSVRPAAVASCAGSPSRSGPATATGPRCPTRGCSTAASATSPASAPGSRRPAATASRPGCRCSARRTARVASARCGSRPAATTRRGPAAPASSASPS